MRSKKPEKAYFKKTTKATKPMVGFIGQGFVGRAYADDFERRGFRVIRYSLEAPYKSNRDKIKDCDIVFIAVPTPTTVRGFDDSIIRRVIKLVGEGKTAVIKSTVLPGTTASIQKENPDIYIFHSPEFLREVSALRDAANPERNIIGIPKQSKEYKEKAMEVLAVLPEAKYEFIIGSEEAELVKYAGNCFFYFKIIFANIFYDVAKSKKIDWPTVRDVIAADSRIGHSHLNPIHQGGRGAGGHCFIKDFAAFADMYSSSVNDEFGRRVLESLRDKNIDLLLESHKDLDLLRGVYGGSFLERFKKL